MPTDEGIPKKGAGEALIKAAERAAQFESVKSLFGVAELLTKLEEDAVAQLESVVDIVTISPDQENARIGALQQAVLAVGEARTLANEAQNKARQSLAEMGTTDEQALVSLLNRQEKIQEKQELLNARTAKAKESYLGDLEE